MIGLLIPLFARWGVAQRFLKPLAWLTAIIGGALLLWAAFSIWLHFHDQAVVEDDRAQSNLEVVKGIVEADRAATEADAARQKDREAASLETKEAIDNAVSENPQAAKSAAGPATRAAADSLSRRARKNSETAR